MTFQSIKQPFLTLLVYLPLIVVMSLAGGCKEPEIPLATLNSLTGDVRIQLVEKAELMISELNQGLFEGNIISTGSESKATVVFLGNNKVELSENTSLLIRRMGSAKTQVGGILIDGDASIGSGNRGIKLIIGTPFGLFEVGVGEALIEIDSKTGLRVLVGTISVLQDGTQTVVDAGFELTVEGLVIPIGGEPEPEPEPEPEIVIEPLSFVLVSRPKNIRVMRKGKKKWTSLKKGSVLGPGDRIQTKKRAGMLQGEDEGELHLDAYSELLIKSATKENDLHTSVYKMTNGTTTIRLDADKTTKSTHRFEINGREVQLKAGHKTADISLRKKKDGKTEIDVRFGTAIFDTGQEVTAGHRVILNKNGDIRGKVEALVDTKVGLAPGSMTDIYYSGNNLPAVKFRWKADRKKAPHIIEIAADKKFEKVLFAEEVSDSKFIFNQLKPGKFYWRVKSNGKWQPTGRVVATRASASGCAQCKRNNIIDDSGESTVVYYQEALPSIQLRWKENPNAASYKLKVFEDGKFDEAFSEKNVDATKYVFPPKKFKEGKYYWLVTALGEAGTELKKGQMNVLEIVYDNTVNTLSVYSPKPGTKVSKSTLKTRGVVEVGSRIYVNGSEVKPDGKGRFTAKVKLKKGMNQVVFYAISKGWKESYLIREVYRR